MATSYTSLLGFALPVTGELSGTWGDVVNNSITQLVEDSVAGVATQSVASGDWTLTTTGSGAANQARCAILIPTGSPGVSRNIIAPSQSKAYIVSNQSDAVVVVKGSATTGASINAGQNALVAWNGSDFVLVASGDVDGPASSTNNAIATFNGTTGKIIQNNTSATISAGVITANGFVGPLTGTVGATSPTTGVFTEVTLNAQGDVRFADSDSSNYVALQAPSTVASNVTFTLPNADGSANQVVKTDGSGNLGWATPVSLDSPVTVVGNSSAGAEIRLPEDTDNGSNYVALKAPNLLSSNVTLTLPSDDGSAGQFMQTDGSGVLSFASVGEVPIGGLVYFAGTTSTSYPGAAWLKCDGAIVSQSTYATLYSRIGLLFNSAAGTWTQSVGSPAPAANFFPGYNFSQSFIYANSKYTILSWARNNKDTIYTSTDFVSWEYIGNMGGRENSFGLAYNGTLYVTGDQFGFGTSTNLVNWTNIPYSGGGDEAYYFGRWVADEGKFIFNNNYGNWLPTSTNGTNWSQSTLGLAGNPPIRNVGYGGTAKFLAVGDSGTLATSTNAGANTWVSRTSGTASTIYVIEYLNNLYIYGGNGGALATSTDAITWTQRTSNSDNIILSLAYGANKYVYTDYAGCIGYSTDAITWTKQTNLTTTQNLASVLYENSQFVLAYEGLFFLKSTDGVNWDNSGYTMLSSTVRAQYYRTDTAFGMIAGDSGRIRTTTDLNTWRPVNITATTSLIYSIIYDTSKYVYVTAGGGIGTSTNGVDWTARTSGTANDLYGVAYNPAVTQKYLAVGNGVFRSSTDAVTWSTRTPPSAVVYNSVTSGGDFSVYVAVGASGTIVSSTDAISWTTRTAGTASQFNSVYFAQSKFVAGGVNGIIATSSDGSSWSLGTSGTSSTIQNVYYSSSNTGPADGGFWWIAGNGGMIRSSTNAINWSTATTGTASVLYSVAFGGGAAEKFIASTAQQYGVIYELSPYTYDTSTEFAVPSESSSAPDLSNAKQTLYIRGS